MDEQESIRDEPVLLTPPTKKPEHGGERRSTKWWGGTSVSASGEDASLAPARPKLEPMVIRFPLKKDIKEPVRILTSFCSWISDFLRYSRSICQSIPINNMKIILLQ